MKRAALLTSLALPLLGTSLLYAQPQFSPPKSKNEVSAQLMSAPLFFEKNQGQAPSAYEFLSHGFGSAIYLSAKEAKIVTSGEKHDKAGMIATLELQGANKDVRGEAEQELVTKVNYFKGADSTKWIHSIPTSARVKFNEIYPGVNLVYYGKQSKLEYDFVVAPKHDPSIIKWNVGGAEKVALSKEGKLRLESAGGAFEMEKPVAYQLDDHGAKKLVSADYVLKNGEVTFALGEYDHSKELVIDPVLDITFSTYVGGNTYDSLSAIAVDARGYVYVTGKTTSSDIPLIAGSYAYNSAAANAFNQDVLIAKLNPNAVTSGSAILFETHLGGEGLDEGTGITVEPASPYNIYVTGNTQSGAFPFTAGVFQNYLGGYQNAFVLKMTNDGSQLLYSTYLGGFGTDIATGISLTSSNGAIVTGQTSSPNFYGSTPTGSSSSGIGYYKLSVTVYASTINGIVATTAVTSPIPQLSTPDQVAGYLNNMYLVRSSGTFTATAVGPVDPSGVPISRTYHLTLHITSPSTQAPELGTIGSTVSFPSISVDPELYTTAITSSQIDFSLTVYLGGAYSNGFITLISGDASFIDMGHSMVFGDPNSDTVANAAAVGSKRIYLTGQTQAKAFIGSLSLGSSGGQFTTQILPGSSVPSSIASGISAGTALAVKLGSDDIYLTGWTKASDFPVFNAFQSYPQTNTPTAPTDSSSLYNAFLCHLSSDLSMSDFSTYLGGSRNDAAYAIGLDSSGYIYVAGQTASNDFPRTSALSGTTNVSGTSALTGVDLSRGAAFVSVFSKEGRLRYSAVLNGGGVDKANGLAVNQDLFATAYITGETQSLDWPVTANAPKTGSTHVALDGASTGYGNGFVTGLKDHTVDLSIDSITIPPPTSGTVSLLQNQPFTYKIVVSNTSTQDATNVQVVQTLDPSLVFVSSTGAVTTPYTGQSTTQTANELVSNLGTVIAGGSAVIYVTVDPIQSSQVNVAATVSADEFDFNSTNDSKNLTVFVSVPAGGITTGTPLLNFDSQASTLLVSSTNTALSGTVYVHNSTDSSKPLLVNYTVAPASSNGFYFQALSGQVSMPVGQTDIPIVIKPIWNQFDVPTTQVKLTLSTGDGYNIAQTSNAITVTLDASPTINQVSLSLDNPYISSTGSATFTASRTGDLSNAIAVNYSLGGGSTLVSGVDFVPLPGIIIIPAGQSSAQFTFKPLVNGPAYYIKYGLVQLNSGNGYILGSITKQVETVSYVPQAYVSVKGVDAGAGGTPGQFIISRTGDDLSNAIRVTYSLSGSAQNAVDYQYLSGVATIPSGSVSTTVSVAPIVNTSRIGSTSVVMTLNPAVDNSYNVSGTNYAATVNLPPLSTVSLSIVNSSALSSGTAAIFRVTRSGDVSQPMTVNYTVGGGANAAVSGVDYQTPSGSVTIASGTDSAFIQIFPLSNVVPYAGVKTIQLQLTSGLGYQVTSPSVQVAQLTYVPLTTVSIAAGANGSESGLPGSFTFTRTGDLSNSLSVFYSLAGTGTNSVNYQFLSGSITIPAGQVSSTVTVYPISNHLNDAAKTVIMSIAPSLYYLADSNASNATITIANFNGPTLSVRALSASVIEGEPLSTAVFRIKRTVTTSSSLIAPLGVVYTLSGSARNGVDYNVRTGVATIPAGKAYVDISIVAKLDDATEGNEDVILSLSPTVRYAVDPNQGSATMTIIDAPPATVSAAADPNASEAFAHQGPLRVIFTRTGSGPFPAINVSYQLSGSATEGRQYKSLGSHVIAFAQGQTRAVLTINLTGQGTSSQPKWTIGVTPVKAGFPGYKADNTTAVVTIDDDTHHN